MLIGALAGAIALTLTAFVKFDFNPLDLRSPKTESVSTILDLEKDPQTSPNTIDVLTPNLDAAKAMAAKLSQMKEVGQAVTLADFVPDDQPAKLKLISDANMLLDPVINPFNIKAAPSDAEVVESLRATAKALRAAAKGDRSRRAREEAADAGGDARTSSPMAAWTLRETRDGRAGSGADDAAGADERLASGLTGVTADHAAGHGA